MKRTPAKRSSLFLLELIIAILFFSLTSAVCVRVFVQAHLISRQTQEQNMALEKISGFTEVFLSGTSLADLPGVNTVEKAVSTESTADNAEKAVSSKDIADNPDSSKQSSDRSDADTPSAAIYRIYYDSDWQLCNVSDACYQIQIQVESQNALLHGTFTALRMETDGQTDTDKVIYSVATDFCPNPSKEATN